MIIVGNVCIQRATWSKTVYHDFSFHLLGRAQEGELVHPVLDLTRRSSKQVTIDGRSGAAPSFVPFDIIAIARFTGLSLRSAMKKPT